MQTAHSLLRDLNRHEGEPHAMQIALHIEKDNPPLRSRVLADAASAVVAVCLDPRVDSDAAYRRALESWYGERIRKIARRARGTAWENVQGLPGVTVGDARAFLPSAVAEVPKPIARLQIKGTDLGFDTPAPLQDLPTIVLDRGLAMSAGKSAAQAGHASMLLAARMPLAWVREWAQRRFVCQVREVEREKFTRLAEADGAVVVRDAGFTEVAPGAHTAVALASPGMVDAGLLS